MPNYYQTTYNSSINQPNQNYYHTATHIDTSQSQPSSNVNSPVPRIHSPSSKSPRGLASGYLTSYNSNYQQNNKSSNNQGKYSLNKNPSMNSQSSTSKYISTQNTSNLVGSALNTVAYSGSNRGSNVKNGSKSIRNSNQAASLAANYANHAALINSSAILSSTASSTNQNSSSRSNSSTNMHQQQQQQQISPQSNIASINNQPILPTLPHQSSSARVIKNES